MILLSMCIFSVQHTISTLENNPKISVSEAIFQTINPFWKLSIFEPKNIFPVNIPLTVDNPHNTEMLISGEIHLFNDTNIRLEKISLINTTETSSGNLVDYLAINPDQTLIPANESKVFNHLWQGFGDQYITADSAPTTIFSTPSEILQDPRNFHLRFYEKAVAKHMTYPVTAEFHLTTLNTTTNISTEQEIKRENITIPYSIVEKTLNSGFIINLGILVVLSLLFWEYSSPKQNYKKSPKLSREELAEIEAEVAKIRENQKNIHKKKLTKNNPKK